MDPFTLIAGATALYNGIKSAVDAGSDVMDTAGKVGDLFSRIAQITTIASTPRKKNLFQSQAEYEAEGIKLYAIKAKAHKMQLDVKNLFVGEYGRAAWEGIQREIIELRKEAARQAAAELKRQQETRDEIMTVFLIVALALGGACVIGVIFYFQSR